ncbi:MAG: hypothetical protein D4R88_06745 [Methanosarcinales archaeon]|nr:MAG: hypothetical protein D4R88_06745 [Methanosarcinales archaeon]
MKMNEEETISLKLPKDALEFAEFYAELGNMDRDTLLTKILSERLKEVREQFKGMPYMNIPETY